MAISIDSVVKKAQSGPPRMVLYGVNGIGKTTLAASCFQPVFILTEDGLAKLEPAHFPIPKTFADVQDQLEALLRDDHQYKTVVIDSLDNLERLIFARVVSDEGKKSVQHIEDIGYGKGYAKALTYWDLVLGLLDRLRAEKKMACVLVGHSLVKTYVSPDSESYDRYRFDLHDKGASAVRDWADIILFANYKTYYDKTDDGKRTLANGSGERVLYTEERPAFWAKNRYGLPPEIPFTKPFDWKAFREAMA